jgi:transcriptional regulator with XRE-family HTH domain
MSKEQCAFNPNRLRELRKKADASQSEVAAYLGVTTAQVSAIELGKSNMTAEKLRALSLFFRQPMEYFFLPDFP